MPSWAGPVPRAQEPCAPHYWNALASTGVQNPNSVVILSKLDKLQRQNIQLVLKD